MSFQYGQFSAGFSLVMPDPRALRFHEAVQISGEDVTIVRQALTGHDGYGNPSYSETTSSEKAIIKRSRNELLMQPGEVKATRAKVLIKQWAPVTEEHTELEINGDRYHIVGYNRTIACIEIDARRKVDG